MRELECQRSLWLSDDGRPMIPRAALRACIEGAARRAKEGPAVRSGLVVDDTRFHFDIERYGDSLEHWGKRCQYTVPVVVQRNRILRTRARFELPWSLEAHVFAAEDLIAPERLRAWLEFAGQRIGLGDWRPERSGSHGRVQPGAAGTCRQGRRRRSGRRVVSVPSLSGYHGRTWHGEARQGEAWQGSPAAARPPGSYGRSPPSGHHKRTPGFLLERAMTQRDLSHVLENIAHCGRSSETQTVHEECPASGRG